MSMLCNLLKSATHEFVRCEQCEARGARQCGTRELCRMSGACSAKHGVFYIKCMQHGV